MTNNRKPHTLKAPIESMFNPKKVFDGTYSQDELAEYYQKVVLAANRRNVAQRLYDFAMHFETSHEVRNFILNIIHTKELLAKVVLVCDRSQWLCTSRLFRDRIEYDGQMFEETSCIAVYLQFQLYQEFLDEIRRADEMYNDYDYDYDYDDPID
jgi:hypothetical protein